MMKQTETGSSSPDRSRSSPDGADLDYASLVERVLAGDRESFRPLVEAFEPVVYGLCKQLCYGCDADAEDLAQETFVRAFCYLPTLKDPQRFGPWLFQIARSLCRSQRRRLLAEQRALRNRAELVRLVTEESAGESLSETVTDVLDELPAVDKEILFLRYFEGLSYERISSRLGMSFSQVDHGMRRARALLARRARVERHRERAL